MLRSNFDANVADTLDPVTWAPTAPVCADCWRRSGMHRPRELRQSLPGSSLSSTPDVCTEVPDETYCTGWTGPDGRGAERSALVPLGVTAEPETSSPIYVRQAPCYTYGIGAASSAHSIMRNLGEDRWT